jgi:hypothetical protein
VVISISCLQTRRVCCQIAHHAAQIQSRLYDHNVFVSLEMLRAHPASNERGPLNEGGHAMWPLVSNLHTAATLHSNHLRQKRLVVFGLHTRPSDTTSVFS